MKKQIKNKSNISVLTIGGATQDVFLRYENPETILISEDNQRKSFLLLEEGSKIDIKSLNYHTGGGATNSAAAFKKMGFDVSTFFKIGRDHRGSFILEDLKKNGILTENIVFSSKTETAISFVIPTPAGDRVILAFRGANADLQMEEIPFDQIAKSRQLYVTSLKSSQLLLPITQIAKEHKIPITVNPGMNQLTTDVNGFMKSLKNIDTLILNGSEALALMQSCLHAGILPESLLESNNKLDNSEYIPELLNSFMIHEGKKININTYFKFIFQNGPDTAVITNGAEGAYAAQGNKIYFHKSLPVKVLNTLGAGDAFGSSFTAGKLMGKEIGTALVYGTINASSVISNEGAKTGLLTLEEIEEKMRNIQVNIQEFEIA